MAYQSGLISDWERRMRTRRAQTGRGLTSAETAGITEPMLAYDFEQKKAAAEREQAQQNFNRQMTLQEQAAKDANRAATISGIADIGMGAGSLYLGSKYLGLMGAKTAPAVANLANTSASLAGPTTFGAAGGGAAPAAGGAAGAPMLATNTTFEAPMLTETAAAPSTLGALGATAGGAGLVLAGQQLGVPALEALGVPKPQAKGFASSGGIGVIGNTVEKAIGGDAGKIAKYAIDPIGSAVQAVSDLFGDLF